MSTNGITALILDFDGTLADTKQSILTTVRETFAHLGLPPVDDERIEPLIGLPLSMTLGSAGAISGELVGRAVAEYRKRYDEIAARTVALFPGVERTLEELQERNIRLAIASSKGRAALLKLVEHLGIARFFAVVAGEQDAANRKPAPDLALFVLDRLGQRPAQAMVVGDTTYDIEMGKAAGCRTCAVTYGNHTAEALRASTPDFIIPSFHEIVPLL